MHLVIPTHHYLFWVVCHPSKTFPLKELGWEPQNRLISSPHRKTIPSLTSDLWTTAPILAGYKWVVPKPYAYSTPIWVHYLSGVHTFVIAYGFVWSCCVFYCSFNSLWRGWVTGSSLFASRFFFGLGIAWVWAFSPLIQPLSPFTFWFVG